jgi:hypothetical protein
MQSPLELAQKPEVRAIVDDARTLLAAAESFSVKNGEQYVDAAVRLKAVKAKQKDLKALREAITKPMNAALDAVRDLFARPEGALKTAETMLKGAMDEYDAAVELKRANAQRALDEEAERQRRKLEQQAQKARDKGQAEKAAQLNERASMVVAPIVQQESPRVSGIARREIWHAEITDFRALVRGVANGEVPLAALDANRTFLNGQARALRAELRYPGVRAVPERNIAAGSA